MTRQKGKTLTAEAWHGYQMMLRAMLDQHKNRPIPRMVAMFGPACFTDYVPPGFKPGATTRRPHAVTKRDNQRNPENYR